MPTERIRSILGTSPFIAIAAGAGIVLSYGLTPVPEPAAAVDILQESGCTPFAEEARVPGTPVWWTYRICPEAGADYRVELRFGNAARTPLAFRYAAWTEDPGRCSGETPVPVIEEEHALAAGADPEVHSTRLPRAGFGGRIWLCVSDVEGLSLAQKVLYAVPCGPFAALMCRRAE